MIPKTPPKRAVKRSLDYSDNNSSVTAITSPGPKPNESPFTKCLRGLMSPIPKVNSEELQPSSGIISRVLRSSDSHKSFYYSPHPPYNLRSKDLNRTSINNDSGIGLTPELYIGKDTPSSSTIARSNSLPNSSSSNIKRINRVRRRFDFN